MDKFTICQHVPFFYAAFAGDFKEAKDLAMNLPDDEPGIFKVLLLWLYDGRSTTSLPTSITINYTARSKLFLLAEKLLIEPLEELVLRDLWSSKPERPTALVYHRQWLLTRNSRIRFIPLVRFSRLLHWEARQRTGFEWFASKMDIDHEFLKEALVHNLRMSYREDRESFSCLAKFKVAFPA